jgi:alpha-glucosidase
VAAVLLLTLRGTPTLYYGDEIGMHQVPIRPDQVRDPFEKNVPNLGLGRDGCRTPMQWDGNTFAGFSTVEPWLPLAADSATANVERERGDPGSLLNLYRRLIALRRLRPALTRGGYRPLPGAGDSLAYLRESEGERVLVTLNFGANPVTIDLPGDVSGQIVLISASGEHDGAPVGTSLTLRGHDATIIGPAS